MTTTANKIVRGKKGQATIEMALSLPFIIWLTYYMINGFYSVHTAHIGQKYAAMGMYGRLNNRAQFSVDDVSDARTTRAFIAVQYTDMEGRAPLRKILVGPSAIRTVVGVCREPSCR
jgi:hypothetical protein